MHESSVQKAKPRLDWGVLLAAVAVCVSAYQASLTFAALDDGRREVLATRRLEICSDAISTARSLTDNVYIEALRAHTQRHFSSTAAIRPQYTYVGEPTDEERYHYSLQGQWADDLAQLNAKTAGLSLIGPDSLAHASQGVSDALTELLRKDLELDERVDEVGPSRNIIEAGRAIERLNSECINAIDVFRR